MRDRRSVSPVGAGRFVGRTGPLAVLGDALARAAAGAPRIGLVGGEAGVGKSRLLAHVSGRAAEDGFLVLHGDCVELGTEGLPLVPVTAALRALVGEPGPDELRRLLPGVDGLLRLLPERDPDQCGPTPQPRLFDLFASLLRQLAVERPVLLVVDDLQWADRSTRDLLVLLARTLRPPARVAVLAAHRVDDLGRRHPLRPLLAQLERLDHVHRFDLGGLSRPETADLVEGLLGQAADPALVDRVHRRSGGNPLFVEELAAAGVGGLHPAAALPEHLQDLLLSRVDALGATARRLVRAAAAAGDHITHALLAATAGALPAAELIAGLEEAVDARVLTADGSGYALRHRLVRDAVLDALLPTQRAELHRACAEALQVDPGLVAPDRLAAARAHHWCGAGEPAMALPALLAAADAAAAVSAHGERAHLLERALQTWVAAPDPAAATGTTRAELFEEAATSALWAGETLLSLRLLDRALAERDRPQDPERVAALLAQRGMALHVLGRAGSVTTLDEALSLLPGTPSPARARVLDLASAVLVLRGAPDRARDLATEAAAIAGSLGDTGLETNVRITLGQALTLLGRHEAALGELHTAGELARRDHNGLGQVRTRLNLATTLAELGRFPEAIAHAEAGVAAAAQAGVARSLGALAAARLGAVLIEVGRLDEAAAVSRRALEQDPPDVGGVALHAVLAEVALLRGESARVREHLALARTLQGGPGDPDPVLLRIDAALALQGNRIDEAADVLLGALAGGVGDWPLLVVAGAVVSAARSHRAARTPRTGPGPDLVDRLGAELRAAVLRLPAGAPLPAACALQVAVELGDRAGGWAAVARRWAELGRPHATAHARLRAAEEIHRTDRPAARELLMAAAATAAHVRAEPLTRDVRAVALAAGLVLDDADVPGPPLDDLHRLGLTARETEVLRLLVAGRSNRQIGETLYISVKTASVHVSNILAKLGVASRGEAAALAHRLRLFVDPRP